MSWLVTFDILGSCPWFIAPYASKDLSYASIYTSRERLGMSLYVQRDNSLLIHFLEYLAFRTLWSKLLQSDLRMLHLACPAMPMILNLYCILSHLGIQFRSAGYVYILNSLQPDDARFGFNIYYNIFPAIYLLGYR